MAQATAQRQPAQTQTQDADPDFARLISKNTRIGTLYKSLSSREEKIESMLPDFMKGQAKRLIARALMTFNNKLKDLQDCPDEDFCRCVVEAAELGFAIDGKLAYVVKYKSTYQLQLDYKAVIAVAKRNRTIIDIDADIVCQNDAFRHGKSGGSSVLEHTYDLSLPRGEVIGAYCRIFLPGGQWNYGVMSRIDLDKIQKMSKASFDGRPWQTWEGEMQKKSVIRRTLKLYQDDPGLMRMLEITSWEDDEADQPAKPSSVSELTAFIQGTLKAKAGNGHAPAMAPGEIPLDTPDEPGSQERPQTGDEPNQDLIDLARMDIAAATDDPGIDFAADELLAKAEDEATKTAINCLRRERKAALQSAGNPKKQQRELVK